jgi:hypothetical protein
MVEALAWMQRADGDLFRLNDTMGDHDIDLDAIARWGSDLTGFRSGRPNGLRAFRGRGIVVEARPASGDYLLVDMAGPTPPHQPGHAHAGALGLELDLCGNPLLIDPGCSGYDGDPFRAYLRGTSAHNTVSLDGKDQSEMWATFRVARRAVVSMEAPVTDGTSFRVTGSCRPYHDRSSCHHRTIRRDDRGIVVEDHVTGGRGSRLELHWHLHPRWTVEGDAAHPVLRHPSGDRVVMHVEGADEVSRHRGETDPYLGWYAEGFGRVVPTWTLRATVHRNDQRVLTTRIEPARR